MMNAAMTNGLMCCTIDGLYHNKSSMYTQATYQGWTCGKSSQVQAPSPSRSVLVDPRRREVSAVRDWPVPASNVELRRFVWMCNLNYYLCFVDWY